MPSKISQVRNLIMKLVAWFLWLPLTGNPKHNRTVGELKRLTLPDLIKGLVPFTAYLCLGLWVYFFFPKDLLPWAGVFYGTALGLAAVAILTTVVINQVLRLHQRFSRNSNST